MALMAAIVGFAHLISGFDNKTVTAPDDQLARSELHQRSKPPMTCVGYAAKA